MALDISLSGVIADGTAALPPTEDSKGYSWIVLSLFDFDRSSFLSFSDELARPLSFFGDFLFPGEEVGGALANGELLAALLDFILRLGGVDYY